MKQLIAKICDNLCFDKIFLLTENLSLLEKVKYTFRKYLTIIFGRKEIVYLGKVFKFDNSFTPVLLQSYPHEIGTLDREINLNTIHSVLDIGANIGQWSFTLKSLFSHLNVISLEPNPKVFPLLRENAKGFSKWKCYNFGVGDGGRHKYIYYSGNGSSEASIYNKISTNNKKKDKIVPVRLVVLNNGKIGGTQIPNSFDLVKIDTEGSELEVLHSISKLHFKYLEVEVSLKRNRGVTVKDVKNFFKRHTRFQPKLLHLDIFNSNSPVADAIFSLT
ncbi:MAG: FkbM family methyltransferase [Patescibacteria group bacterium]